MPSGNGDYDIRAVGAVLASAASVAAPRSSEDGLCAERGKVTQVRVRDDDDIASATPVPSVRPAAGNVLLAAEAQSAVTAAACLHTNARTIVEHESVSTGRRRRLDEAPEPHPVAGASRRPR